MTLDLHPDDYDTRDGEIARRNVLFGLWAGHVMGMKGDAIETYAWSVHLADLHAPGHDDVIAKVASDLAASGKPMKDRQLRDRLHEMAMRASLDLAQSDRETVVGASSRAKHTTKKLKRKETRHRVSL
jgi:hypothetical protein